MGCCGSISADASDPARNDERYARQLQAQEDRASAQRASAGSALQPTILGRQQAQPGWSGAGAGHTLGGTGGAQEGGASLTAEERKQRALEAAQRRQDAVPGISKQKAAEMREKASKEEYMGKLTEHYRKKGTDMPLGLNAASAQQLKGHWEQIRSADPAGAVLKQ